MLSQSWFAVRNLATRPEITRDYQWPLEAVEGVIDEQIPGPGRRNPGGLAKSRRAQSKTRILVEVTCYQSKP